MAEHLAAIAASLPSGLAFHLRYPSIAEFEALRCLDKAASSSATFLLLDSSAFASWIANALAAAFALALGVLAASFAAAFAAALNLGAMLSIAVQNNYLWIA